jgi:hypothetical protein
MSEPSQATNQSQILGAFAGVVTLLSVALYFTGWIYRWAYFGFFSIQHTTLDFPAQSYFFLPIWVFLGDFQSFIRAFIILGIAIGGILVSLKLLKSRRVDGRFSTPLVKDTVIVAWILVALFWIARWQGEINAQKDAVNKTSQLPVIALVDFGKTPGIGYRPKDETYSSLDKVHVIGDVGLLVNKLRGTEVKTPGTPSQVGDWRLLASSKGWLYVFQALSSDVDRKRRPVILAVREGGGEQLMILSPTASEQKSP